MSNSAEKITKNLQEILNRQVPREDAKKIAKVATVIITVIVFAMCFMILTAQSHVLGEWKSGVAYDDGYTDAGYYYVDFEPNGECWVSFDIEDSILGWGTGGNWSVTSMSMTGIDITVRTDWEETLPNKTVYHYNPFTNRVTRDSWVYKKIE